MLHLRLVGYAPRGTTIGIDLQHAVDKFSDRSIDVYKLGAACR